MKKTHKVEVDTKYYEAAHGKKPRGHGSFFFDMGGNGEPYNGWIQAPFGTYVQARKYAVAHARKIGVSRVYVSS